MEISLEQLLLSRDERQRTQRELLDKYKDKVLLCLTVIMPGKTKRNDNSLFVAAQALKSIEQEFSSSVLYRQEKDLQTGFEAYFVVEGDAKTVKKRLVSIEEQHPLGRLFDIDVIDFGGVPISRKDIGIEPRKCLICGNESRYCMRNFTHTQEELQNKITEMINEYKSNQLHRS